ncbi:MAG: sugar phosphate isomerase/epimerase [Anaerolineae bacterium]|nr:sugar phosphate isomerase/epimerase [Anaerolineae bacterium]
MKLGIATSVYVNFPLEAVIPRLAAAGYDVVDIWGGRPHVYRRDYDQHGLESLRTLIEQHGMRVASFLPAFFRYPHNLASPNPIVRADSLEYVRLCAENAAILGASYLLICPPRLLHGQTPAEGWNLFAESLKIVCDEAERLSLKVILEPVNVAVFDLINTAADAMKMVHQLNRSNLGVVLDTGHLHLSNETFDQALDILSEKLFLVQVNDNDGKRQQNLVPGDGTFDFKAFFSALRQRGFDGVVSAELSADYALNPDPPVQETIRRLRAWINS